jgi:hypothetical protein
LSRLRENRDPAAHPDCKALRENLVPRERRVETASTGWMVSKVNQEMS